jgi:hypothetical protein
MRGGPAAFDSALGAMNRSAKPGIAGPRRGDPADEQQRFMSAKSVQDTSVALAPAKSPCRWSGPAMRGGPAALDSARAR